jgi:eukaryotic-like serine/threonine-protein kinase
VATAGVNRLMLWTDLEGRELNGQWRLVKLVRPEGRTAWFEGTGPNMRPAMLSITEALNDEDELLERLRAAAEIRHPNVVAIREAQLACVEDTPVVVAEMEPTEENLGDVLRERTLNADEARMVMDALLAGLGAIHRKKLIHGRMDAASVVAMDDTIKLRSDFLQLPGSAFATRAGEDVRGIGRIVVQALTRRVPAGEHDPVLQLLPESMARAARRALAGDATVEEVAALAGIRISLLPEKGENEKASRAATPSPRMVRKGLPEERSDPANRQEKAAPVETDNSVKAQPAPRVIAIKAAAAPGNTEQKPAADPEVVQLPLLMEDDEPDSKRRRSAPYIVGAAVVLLLLTVFVLYGLLRRHSGPQQAAPHPSQQVEAVPATEAPSLPARRSSPGNIQTPATGVLSENAATSGPGWRVVAYTYNRPEPAEQKARSLAQQYPELKTAVFSPRGRSPYLVTLGGVMSRADAYDLRAKVVRMGLPKDTYAQNFR